MASPTSTLKYSFTYGIGKTDGQSILGIET